MDTIEFRPNALKFNGEKIPAAVADIFINGNPLWESIFKAHASIPVTELYENLSVKYKIDAVSILGNEICPAVYVTVEVGANTVTWKNFASPDENFNGEFIFDREQYFREIDKLKQWALNDSLTVEYGGIECGDLSLVVKKSARAFNFYFDENVDDPFPALVRFFNAIVGGENFSEAFMYNDDNIICKLSFKLRTDGQILFCTEIVRKDIIFSEIYHREELAAMLKKIFDALLTDRYFPYSYPSFFYVCCIDEDENITDEIEAEHPDWAFGDVLNYAFAHGRLKFEPSYEEFLSTYKKMLTEYVVPESWR